MIFICKLAQACHKLAQACRFHRIVLLTLCTTFQSEKSKEYKWTIYIYNLYIIVYTYLHNWHIWTFQQVSALLAFAHSLLCYINDVIESWIGQLSFLNAFNTKCFTACVATLGKHVVDIKVLLAFLDPLALDYASCSLLKRTTSRAIVNFCWLLAPACRSCESCPLVMYTLYSGWRGTLLTPELCKKQNNSTEIYINLYAPFFKEEGVYCFWPVCLSVTLSVQNFNLGLSLVITFAILNIATSFLACMCISWSCTFWVVKGQGHPSRSKIWVKIAQKGALCFWQTHLLFHFYIIIFQYVTATMISRKQFLELK